MAKSKLSGALAFGAALMLLPVAAAASEHSEEQSEAQPQIITPEEFLEDALGLIERYSQHGSGDDEAEGQWRHAPPLEEDLPEGQWHHTPPLEEDLPEGQWHHAPPLEDDDAPSEKTYLRASGITRRRLRTMTRRLKTTIPGITTTIHGSQPLRLRTMTLRLRTTIPGITTMPHGVRRHHSRTMSPIWIVPS